VTIGDLAVTGSTISAPSNADLTLTTSGTGSVSVDGIQIKGTELSSSDSTQITIKENLHVTGNITGTLTGSVAFSNVTSTPTTLAGYGITDAASSTATALTVVGDDSSGTAVTLGETFKVAGATGVTTAVSGDTLTITGPDLSSYLQNTGTQTIDNLSFNDNIISTSSNADLNLDPGGTGNVKILTDQITLGTGSSAGTEAVAIGKNTNAGNYAQAIGNNAGNSGQGQGAVALGSEAGETNQGSKAVAIGNYAGETTQGANAIAIGEGAGKTNQAANSIVINASGSDLNNTTASSLVVKPIRNASGTHQLEYNPTTGEVTYDTLASGGATGITFTGDDSAGINIADGGQLYIQGGTGITTSANSDGTITITASGGSGLQSRSTATGTTGSLADAAQADLDITGFKSYMLATITTDRAARVRLYTTAAARTADASRAEGVDPTSDAGVIAEVITTGAETVTISPGALGFNLESPPTTNIPCRVTNKSGGTSTVQVSLHVLQLEA